MKTVIDAVNEFRGEWPYAKHMVMIECKIPYGNYVKGDISYFYSSPYEVGSYWHFTCTKKEFNQCVKEIETNWGTSQSYSDYRFDYHLPHEPVPVYTQAMHDNGELPSVGMECHIDGTGVVYIIILPKDSEGDFILTPKKGDKYWQRSNVKYVKPIDTRTDEEKALDDMMDAYFNPSKERPSKHSTITITFLEAIKAGKIHGITWSK